MKKIYLIVTSLLLGFAGSAFAGLPSLPVTALKNSATQTQVKAYAGLSWTLGSQNSSLKPAVIVGLRSLNVNSNDKVNNGVDISARFKLTDGATYDSARLSYVSGNRDLQTLIGFGYSNVNKSFLATLAGQGAYSRVGVDYEFTNSKLLPYLDLLTVGRPATVNSTTTYSCPAGFTLVAGTCQAAPT